MYTTNYWIVVTWRRDQCVTWHVGWGFISLVTTPLSLWTLRFVKVKIKYYWFVTWWLDRSVTSLFGWSSIILSHHPAKFEIHRLWESGNITPLICQVTTCLMYHVIFGWGSVLQSHHPGRFGFHRPCESEDITSFICHVTTKSKCHMTLWVESSNPNSPPC